MDLTETFRSDDISKADFFDFVVAPDMNDAQALQQFTKQMRTVNAYLGNGDTLDLKETNNNSQTSNNNNNNTTSASVLASTPTPDDGTLMETTNSVYDSNFWSCDKETVRLETAILEDLNKYCWSQQDVHNAAAAAAAAATGTINPDGSHIYTLTVLNGVDQTTPWFRPPLAAIIKDEDGSLSSPGSLEHMQQSGLDIDSILSIIPSGAQLNGYATPSPNTDGLIKSETYTYDDSGFADNKDELTNTMIIDTPMLEAHDSFNNNNTTTNNNNNNDWKINNNNNSNSSGADSLLRSALQGKAFVRYNGTNANVNAKTSTTTPNKRDTHSELRRALSTPPAHAEQKDAEELPLPQPVITGIDPGAILFVEAPARLSDNNSPTTHSMDDILLSQLDAASYPEDYEKLKRIANEVAESVQQYCQLEPLYGLTATAATTTPTTPGEQTTHQQHQPVIAASVVQLPQQQTVTSSKPPQQPKKYKRSNSAGAANTSNTSSSSTVGNSGSGNTKQMSVQGAAATSTSNGVRKERSLHYCSICSKGFKDKYSVNVHIRTHTGEKPFACSLCGKSFRQKAHLAKHYQTHIAQKNAAASGQAAATASSGASAANKPAKAR